MRDHILKIFRPVDPGSPLMPVARRYAWSIPAVAFLGFLASLLEGLGISLLIPLLGTLLATGPVNLPGPLATLSALAERFEPDTRLIVVGLAILAFVALKGLVQALNGAFIAWIDGRASHDVRVALAERLLTVGYPFFLREDFARLINIVGTDSWRASDAIRLGFTIVANIAASVVFAALLLMVHWKLTLVVGAGAVAIRLAHNAFMKSGERMSETVSASNLVLGERMLHIIQGMRLIRVFGQERREVASFGSASDSVRRIMTRVEAMQSAAGGIIETANAALFIGVLIGAYFAGIQLPTLVAFLVLLYRFQPFLRSLSASRLGLAATKGSVREVEWLLDPAGKPRPPGGDRPIASMNEGIVFDAVDFTYPGNDRAAPAITGLSFRLARGRSTALIGASGSGKSTVTNLICRLLEPTGGRIFVDGVALDQIAPDQWRARIGFAGQDVDLIDGSLADNIRYGAPNATDAEVAEAARLAEIDGFIAGLPQGYGASVGSGGLGLSGGQRQRIGLARAFVRRPDLLILDEATNAVDALSEAAILRLLAACSWRPTTLVVSHRSTSLAACDDGVALEGGRLVEAGPLKGLKAYRAMLRTEDQS